MCVVCVHDHVHKRCALTVFAVGGHQQSQIASVESVDYCSSIWRERGRVWETEACREGGREGEEEAGMTATLCVGCFSHFIQSLPCYGVVATAST